MVNKIILAGLVIVFGIIGILLVDKNNKSQVETTLQEASASATTSTAPTQSTESEKKFLRVGNTKITIEEAITPEEQAKGLSGRSRLEENQGMLFVMADKRIPSFWMKGMLISLDFLWILDNTVVDITEDVPAPRSLGEVGPPSEINQVLPTYSPKQPVNYVLEVNAGFIKKHGITIGDTVKYEQ